MNSTQYEELCRFFLSERLGVDAHEIRSVRISNPRRPGLPEFKHQIDLYWETGDELSLYLNIANAKWRGSDKVDQPEVLLLQQVRQKVGAHKAFMITSRGFTTGAEAAAQDEGIALHVVRPEFDVSVLPSRKRSAILSTIQEQAADSSSRVYSHKIVHRAYDFSASETRVERPPTESPQITRPATRGAPKYSTRTVTGPTTRTATPGTTRSISSGFRRGGGVTRGGGSGSGR